MRLAALWVVVLGGVQSNVSTNHAKIMILEPRGGGKINQIVARRTPKAILEASRFWDPQKVSTPGARHTLLDTIWPILGAILGTIGRQGVPKNRQFWHQDAPKSQNMTSKMRHRKKFEV